MTDKGKLDSTFSRTVVSMLWNRIRPREPRAEEYTSLGAAVYRLRTHLGMTHDQFTIYTGEPRIKFTEMRGQPISAPLFERMIRLAREYSLLNLAEYLESELLMYKAGRRHVKRKSVPQPPHPSYGE